MNAAQSTVTGPAPRVAFVSGAIHEGGSTTFLVYIGGELVRRGASVAVFSAEKDNPYAAEFRSLGIPTTIQDHHREIYEDRIRATLEAVRDYGPSVVVASHSSAPWEVLRYLPRALPRIGVILMDHPSIYEFLRPYAPWVDDMVCISHRIAATLKALPEYRSVPVHFIHGGATLPAAVVPRTVTNDPLRILYHGRLERAQKRVHLFPVILKDLVAAGIPFSWSIRGDGTELDNLKNALKTVRKDQTVSFVGKLPAAQLPEFFQKHDVSLLASVAEGLPMSMVETMASGVVPVVSDLESGIREVVDETNGILVPVDDIAGYAKAIIYLHEHRERLRAMSIAAQERVQQSFSIRTVTDQWIPLLNQPPKSEVAWPSRWDIQAPLACAGSFRFSLPARVLRRFKKRLGI